MRSGLVFCVAVTMAATSVQAFETSGEMGTSGFGVLTGNANSDYSRGDIDGSVELGFSNLFSAQIDVSATGYTGSQSELSALSGGVHLIAHPNDKLAIGVFAYADSLYSFGLVGDVSITGLEATYQIELSPSSSVDLTGSVSELSGSNGSLTAYAFATSSYVTENVVFNVETGGVFGDFDANYFGIGLGYDIMPALNVSGRYVRQNYDNGYNDAFGLGLGYKFGKGSTFGNHQFLNVIPGI